MRCLRQARMKLLNEPRFAEPWLADDQYELAFAGLNALPPARQQAHLFLAADKRRQPPRATPSATAACSNDAKQLDRL